MKAKKQKEDRDYYLPDTRPIKHDDDEPANDDVLKAMVLEDVLDSMDW